MCQTNPPGSVLMESPSPQPSHAGPAVFQTLQALLSPQELRISFLLEVGGFFAFWSPLACLVLWAFSNSSNYNYFLRINHLQCHWNAAHLEQRTVDVEI